MRYGNLSLGSAAFSFIVCTMISVSFVAAQDGQTAKSAVQKQNQQVTSIYEMTKTAKSSTDYSKMIAEIDSALATELTAKNTAYVTSLKGWALNRRGLLRLETAEQLAAAGSSQAEQAMKLVMADFDQAIECDDQRWRSWLSRGIAWVSQREYEAAIKDFSQVIEMKPAESKAWFNRAEANFYAENYPAAVADYDAVLAMTENDAQALTGRGHAAYAQANFKRALADFELVHNQHPKNCEAIINLADAYQALGRWEEAEDSYFFASRQKPSPIPLQRLAWLKATCPDATFRDTKNAKQLIEKAILLGGESPVVLDTLAAVEAANGNFDAAKQNQEKAIRLVDATSPIESDSDQSGSKKTEYQTRMAMYEEGVPYQQKKKD